MVLTQRSGRHQKQARAPGSARGFALQGVLEQFPLATLLTIMEMERRSGALSLRQGTYKPGRGKLIIRSGRVIAARLTGAGSAVGREAVYTLLRWRTGRFAFRSGAFPHHDELRTPTARLLLEAAQRLDEAGDCTPLAS